MDENVQITTENYPEQFIEITKQYLDFLRQYSQGSSSDMVFEGLRETGEQLYDLIERVNSEIKFIEGVSEKIG